MTDNVRITTTTKWTATYKAEVVEYFLALSVPRTRTVVDYKYATHILVILVVPMAHYV